jgi:uncharacterized membrane protein YfcA
LTEIFHSLDALEWAAFAASCFVAYFLKGFSGFGPALIFVPTATVLFGPTVAIAGSTFLNLLVGFGMWATMGRPFGEARLVARMVGLMAIGTLAGAGLAGAVPSSYLLALIGIAVTAFGASFLLVHRPIPEGMALRGSRALWGACLLGGLTGGLVGISGPFVVAATRPLMDKTTFRRVMVAVMFFEKIVRISVYGAVGIWSDDVLAISAVAAVPILFGILLGMRAHFRVSERGFSLVIGTILVLLGGRVLASLVM